MKRFLLFSPLIIALVLGVVLYSGIGKDPTMLQSARLGKTVPDFKLPSLFDPAHSLTQKIFPGKVSLLNVWATWCTTCKAEHPWLVKIAKETGITVHGIDYKDNRDDALKWLKTLGNPYEEVIFDKEGTLGLNLGVYGVPETYVLDKRGIIRYRQVGAIDENAWMKTILPLINKLKAE
jgi:cytochrome c biogenesis protein CcmG/thiol:disulfide interchange protein DsbE